MKKLIFENFKTLFYALVIAVIIRSFFFQPFYIPSSSMEPNLLIGDRLFVSKFSYGYSRHSLPFSPKIFKNRILENEPEVGDIIVFTLPTDSKRVIVHRVNSIDEKGEKGIEIKTKGDNNPKVDGWTVLEEDYIGTVITSVPSIGKITIWLSPPVNYYIIFFVVLILLTNEVKKK